ncbi:MAG: glycosyltransferase family 2 protein [Patescibacteria group bacterium]
MQKYPKVSIIITNYNGGQILLDCIESVKKIDYPNFELVLIDDNSTDGSYEKVLKNKESLQLVYFKNNVNLGFVRSNNKGFELSSGKYVLLLNNDTTVNKDLLTKLISRMETDPKIGAAQAKIKMMDNPKYLDNSGSYLTKTGFLIHWGFGKKNTEEFSSEKIIFSAKGACLMTKKEIIEKVGLFDKDFVSYFEESDFCWRVWLAGYTVYFLPQTYINHKLGFSYSKINQELVNYNSFKNRILSLYKNLETKNLFLIFIPHILIILGLSLYYLLKLQFSKSSMIIGAIWWNIKNFKNSYKKRNLIQKMRVISDDNLFKFIMKEINLKEMFDHFAKVEANFRK